MVILSVDDERFDDFGLRGDGLDRATDQKTPKRIIRARNFFIGKWSRLIFSKLVIFGDYLARGKEKAMNPPEERGFIALKENKVFFSYW